MSRRQVRILEGSTFGQRLRSARKAQDPMLTQEGLARRVDVTLRTIQRWEGDDSEPGGGQLMDVARALDVDATDLYPVKEVA